MSAKHQTENNNLLDYRSQAIDKLKKEEFDILVIGGGITGAGIARDASLRGYSVALIEKNDFGFGTSSGSSKLVHAGFRYLAQKEFGLVREASVERKRILEMIPHLTRPLPFLIPLHSDTVLKKSKIRIGLWAYDFLAGFRNYGFHKLLNKKKAKELLPKNVREENFQGAGYYFDGQMDDARVTLEVVLSAEQSGATVVNYVKATNFIKDTTTNIVKEVEAEDNITGEKFIIKARTIAVATGHWTDYITNNIDSQSPKRIRPTKGIHIITKRFYDKEYAVTCTAIDGRVIFIVPFGKYNLIGTTDTDYTGDPDYVPVEDEDVNYLIDSINGLFSGALTKEDIVSAYSGVRPLINPSVKTVRNGQGSEAGIDESSVSRTHEIFAVAPNVLVIAGGKFTTFRKMAEEFVDRLDKMIGKKRSCKTTKTPYYGWNKTTRKKWDTWKTTVIQHMKETFGLDEDIAEHLTTYGIHYKEICELFSDDSELKSRISDSRPYIMAEIDYFVRKQYALSLNDVMLRRTQIQLSENQGLDCLDKIAQRMAQLLGWNDEKIRSEIESYKKSLVWKG